MSTPVNLSDIIEAMEFQAEEMAYYFDRRTARIEMVADEAIVGEIEEMQEIAEAVEADTEGRFVALPDQFDIHEWEMIRRFTDKLEDRAVGDELRDSIRGQGAFRRFKDKVVDRGVDQQWYAFRDEQYRRIAIDWCEATGVAYTDDRAT